MLTERNAVFIAVLIFYTGTAIFSTIRLIQHGLRKTASERILLVFSIGRILCAAFQLATISYPTNTSVWAGYVTTFSICVSLLLSASLVLLRRLAQRAGTDFPQVAGRDSMKFCQILVTVGLILGIAGGIKATSNWGSTGSYKPDSIQKASIIIFIISWALIVFMAIHTLGKARAAGSQTQKIAVGVFAISLPLLAVRIAYSAVSIFANLRSFSSIYGNVTIMLCMALIEEAIVVLMYQALGFVTLEEGARGRSIDSDLDQLSMAETGVVASK
ncbi:hypothetical protein D6C78_05263 [Aureobasidium pullulans]|uniref:DUF7702 domain-containing protein n=1 Tax=Aureobasidium pullulans TaxID=5580 RepID=A0A4T0BXY4_AURPU|nr:hypothetical protein D6C78_05263 [Aureobasidium pullulans]